MQVDFWIVDVFSTEPFGGNQLAVIPNAAGLSTAAMQKIAREFNFAETTFVLPPEDDTNTARVRIFTPKAELPFAGHPTIGTAAVLVEERLAPDGRFLLELGVGTVAVEAIRNHLDIEGTLVREGEPEIRDSEISLEQLANALRVPRELVQESFDASAGLPFCFVRLDSAATVDRAQLDLALWSDKIAKNWAPQLYIFAGELSDGAELYARMFAPGLGVDEDPATGSAAAALVGAAAARSNAGSFSLSITQGVLIGRRSKIGASAEVRSGRVARVRVRGSTNFFAHGRLTLPRAALAA